jgi:hypothetical protein
MLKWIIALVCVAIAGWFFWFQINTTKISYVNGLDGYSHLPNREYVLVQDCYVFAWRHPIGTSFPLLGTNAPGAATRVNALPAEVSRAQMDQPRPGVRLMDPIPQGTRIKLLSVRREESRRTGTVISYEIKFLDDVDRPYQRVDIRPTLLPVTRAGDPPDIDPTIAVPWIKR